MDPKELDDKIKSFVSDLPNMADYDKALSDITNEAASMDDASDDAKTDDYKLGYDTGFIDGYEEGQLVNNYDRDSSTYNDGLNDAIEVVESFHSPDKDSIIELIKVLRRP